jgi:hypothetical protein
VVSNGLVQLPDVTRQPSEEAITTLRDQLGLTVTPQSDPGCTGETVSGMSVPPGDVAQGSAVTLRICTG